VRLADRACGPLATALDRPLATALDGAQPQLASGEARAHASAAMRPLGAVRAEVALEPPHGRCLHAAGRRSCGAAANAQSGKSQGNRASATTIELANACGASWPKPLQRPRRKVESPLYCSRPSRCQATRGCRRDHPRCIYHDRVVQGVGQPGCCCIHWHTWCWSQHRERAFPQRHGRPGCWLRSSAVEPLRQSRRRSVFAPSQVLTRWAAVFACWKPRYASSDGGHRGPVEHGRRARQDLQGLPVDKAFLFTLSQVSQLFTVPPRAHPSTGSQSGSATPT
jgi:hypothetical protein